MDILKRPGSLSLSGNMGRLVVATTHELLFVLRDSKGAAIVENSYSPNDQGRVEIDVKSIVTPLLSFTLKDVSNPYEQTKIAQAFTAELTEEEDALAKNTQSFSFTVLRAGVDELSDAVENFLEQNFLTWQPNMKPVTYYSPEFLTYYAVTAATMKCRATLEDGSTRDLTMATIPAGECWTVPLQYAIIAGRLSAMPVYYDVWMENTSGQRMTYIQRYYADDMRSQVEQWVLFENSLGGIDTFRAYGDSDNTADHTHNVVEIDEEQMEYRVDTERNHTKNTGYLDTKERTWLLDFFPSLGKYIYTDQHIRQIVVTESDVNYKAKTLPSSYTFTYRYATAQPYLNLPRTDTPQEVMELKVPDVGSFTIAPRLVEFPRQVLSRGALFPIQDPYSEGWGTTTMTAIQNWIVQMIEEDYDGNGGIGHHHDNISLLDALALMGDYLTTNGKKINAGFADEARTLKNNEAPETISFLNGIKMGVVLINEIISSADINKELTDTQLVTAKALKAMVDKGLSEKYLRKDVPDTAKEIITFQKGLKANFTSYFYAGVYTAGMAVFKNLLTSETFVSGWSPIGKGWKLWLEEYENIAGEIDTKAKMELDELTVRGTFRVFEFVINQLRGENDNYVFAGMMKVDHFEAPDKIWLDTNKGETYNPFRTDDILRCQQFRGNTIKQYTLMVEDAVVGSLDEGENRMDYITIKTINSQLKFEGNLSDIQKGDILVRLDNLTDPERKGIVNIDSIGSSAPSLSVSYGTITDPEKSLRVRLGKLDGITDPLHGALSGYGLYGNKVYLTGEFKLVTGEDVRTAFIVHENMLASVQTQTTYDITDEDMLLANCSFMGDLDHWTADEVENDGMYSIDGVPLMHDYGILSNYEHTVAVAVLNGKRMLQITDSGITQKLAEFQKRIPEDYETTVYVRDDNDEIMVDENGMPLTETVKKRRTFYVWLRYQCRRGKASADGSYGKTCSLKVGFLNGKSYKVTGDEGDIVTIPSGATAEGEDPQGDICMVEYTVGVNDESWTDIRFKGYYDSSSDFRIETDGDLLIDNLVVTWHELDEYKHIVSTALLQHDGIIGMYGRNIAKNGKDIVEVGNQVDANKKEWKAWVSGSYETDKQKIYNAIKINEQGITALASKVDGNSEKISKLEITADSITQRVSKIEGDYITSGELTVESNKITAAVKEQYDGVVSRVSALEITAEGITQRVASIEKDYVTSGELKVESDTITAAVEEQYNGVASKVSALEITSGSITQRVAAIEGDYITSGKLTAESNRILGVVSETYGDVPTRVSKLELTASGLTSTVSALGNPNLLSCADGNGWFTDYNLQTKASFDISTQKVASADAYSLKVYLIGGNTYCFSYYGSSASLYLYKGSSYTAFGAATKDTTRETYQGYYLYYKTFAPSETGMYVINLYGSNPFYRPKLESGTVPTFYDTTVQSSINQTANEIRLTADKITLEGLVTANSNFKILQDGSMEAVNGKFSGELNATSGKIAGMTITNDSISSSDSSMILRSGGLKCYYNNAYMYAGIINYIDISNGDVERTSASIEVGKSSIGIEPMINLTDKFAHFKVPIYLSNLPKYAAAKSGQLCIGDGDQHIYLKP